MLVRDRLAAAAKLLHLTRDRRLSDRRDRHRTEHRIDISGDISAVAREGGRLDTRQVLDMGGQPGGHRRNVTADLVELDDAQRLLGAVVLQRGLETLCRGRVSNVSERWRPSCRHSTR